MPKASKKAATPEVLDELSAASLVEHINDKHGEGAASVGGVFTPRDYISTQSAVLNYKLGRPGVPTGTITNLYGTEGSGKSTLGYHLLTETQDRGGIAILCDSEGAYDFERGERIGIDYDKLVMLTPRTLEQAFDEIKDVMLTIHASDPDRLICIDFDSVAAQATQSMIDAASYGDIMPADRARIISYALPELNKIIGDTNTALILVNQLRAKLEFGPSWGGPKETQTGENSIKYYSLVRMHLRAAGTPVGDKNAPTAIEVTANIIKNKTAPPFRKATFQIRFWDGIDKVGSKLAVAEEVGLVAMRGGWYQYEEKKFRRDDFADVLKSYPELDEAIAQAPLLWMTEESEND